ncbi:MAG: hypothetical protein KKA81_11255 [Bacteroidetes bacterium]|nr:hypothetical protein [Bacteroidota bacterium]
MTGKCVEMLNASYTELSTILSRLTIVLLFLAVIPACFSQEYFTAEQWNFRIIKISEPYVFQDEITSYTASFNLGNRDMLLLEIYPRGRDCFNDSLCLIIETERILEDIKNQDRKRFDGLERQDMEFRVKNGFNSSRHIYASASEHAVIDLYLTEGFVYALSLTTKQDPSAYIDDMDSFEFLRELKDHGARKQEFQRKKDAIGP